MRTVFIVGFWGRLWGLGAALLTGLVPGALWGQWAACGSGQCITSGNVGIGTTAPAYPLSVNGPIGSNAAYSAPANAGTVAATGEKLVAYESSAFYRAAIGMSSAGLYLQNTYNTSGGGNSGIQFFGGLPAPR